LLAESKKAQEDLRRDLSAKLEQSELQTRQLAAELKSWQEAQAKPLENEVSDDKEDLRKALAAVQGSLDIALSRESELLSRRQQATDQLENKERENEELRKALLEAREESLEVARQRDATFQVVNREHEAHCADLQGQVRSAEKMADALAYVLAKSMGWNAGETTVGISPDEEAVIPERRVPSTVMDSSEIKLETDESKSPMECSMSASEPFKEPTPTAIKRSRNVAGCSKLAPLGDQKETIRWIRRQLEHQHGDLATAFSKIDDNTTRQITVTKLTKALDEYGVARHLTESLFRRLSQLAQCRKRGALTLQDWLAAWREEDA